MLPEIVERLRCPVCAAALATRGPSLACAAGHSFDLARQGYVSLLAGPAPAVAETPAMVAARSSLLSGRYAPLVAAVAERAAALARVASPGAGLGCVVDAGAGPGHYLAALLDRRAELVGIALDVAKPAARAAARAHPRLNAIVADAWRSLPLRDGAADLLLNVFAPRNGAEFRRILAPHGALLVVTPTADHLGALVRALDLLTVDPAKDARLSSRSRSNGCSSTSSKWGDRASASRASLAGSTVRRSSARTRAPR